jgi:hypothetical protein
MADEKTEKWTHLWELEQKLILLLDKIHEKRFLKEGSRKTVESDQVANIFQTEPKTQNRMETLRQLKQNRESPTSSILLPGENFLSSKSPDFTDDFMGNLRSLEASLENNQLTIPGLLLNITSERSKPVRKETPSQMPLNSAVDIELQQLIDQAANISLQVFNLHQELEDETYLCDTMTVKEANIKTGGDGFKTVDGEKVELPNHPLSKTCPKRKGNWEAGKWLFECVVCPINYLQTSDRLHAWQDFLSAKNKINTNTKNDGE